MAMYLKKPNGRYIEISDTLQITIRQNPSAGFDIGIAGQIDLLDVDKLASAIVDRLNALHADYVEFMKWKEVQDTKG